MLFCDDGQWKFLTISNEVMIATLSVELTVLIRPLQMNALLTCFSVFQHFISVERVQYYTIKSFASPSAENVTSGCFFLFVFVILSNECDNQLYIVMVHLNSALPKQKFILQFVFSFVK